MKHAIIETVSAKYRNGLTGSNDGVGLTPEKFKTNSKDCVLIFERHVVKIAMKVMGHMIAEGNSAARAF